MFGYITGHILARDGIGATILVEGTGLGLDILLSPAGVNNTSIHGQITLWIHHHKTDVSETLFGFVSLDERRLFRELMRVNGVGGKTALSLLSLGEATLMQAIQLEDDKLLSSVPGIGKKTAQKIIVDLKGSIDFGRQSTAPSPGVAPTSNSLSLLSSSLVQMGYDKNRVESVVTTLDDALSIEQKTIEAIKKLSQ